MDVLFFFVCVSNMSYTLKFCQMFIRVNTVVFLGYVENNFREITISAFFCLKFQCEFLVKYGFCNHYRVVLK